MMSMNVLTLAFMAAKGSPSMLPEQSSTMTMSAGLETMSGPAERERISSTSPPQEMVSGKSV